MRANLERLNAAKKAKAAETTKLLARIAELMPSTIASWDLRKTLGGAIEKVGGSASPKVVHKVLMAMRRRGMLTYLPESVTWTVAYPRVDDNVGT